MCDNIAFESKQDVFIKCISLAEGNKYFIIWAVYNWSNAGARGRSIFAFLLAVKIHTITLHVRTWIAISRKSTLKSIFYSFWDKCLKPGMDQNNTFDRAYFWFRPQKWKYRIFKILNLHFCSIQDYLQL